MSSVFVIPICVATVTLGLITCYICGETNYCSTCDQTNNNAEDYKKNALYLRDL